LAFQGPQPGPAQPHPQHDTSKHQSQGNQWLDATGLGLVTWNICRLGATDNKRLTRWQVVLASHLASAIRAARPCQPVHMARFGGPNLGSPSRHGQTTTRQPVCHACRPSHIEGASTKLLSQGHLVEFLPQLWGELLHEDMFAHNESGIAYRDRNRRSETVVDHKREPHQQPRLLPSCAN
jgi:hypothetical protein